MEIHWRNPGPISADAKAAATTRIERLANGHSDLIDVWVDVASNRHRTRGAEEVAIRCQARGVELVAHGYAAEPALALREALVSFEREVKRMRERRESKPRPPRNGSAQPSA